MFFRKKFSTGSSYLGFKNIIYFIIIFKSNWGGIECRK